MRTKVFLFGTLILFCITTGCGQKEDNQKQVLAIVNGYEVTSKDFEKARSRYSSMGNLISDEKILEILIDEILLLQEAEKMKINRDEQFLQSIEHHWRQSLIQELINRKSREISGNMHVANDEERQDAMQLWMADLKQRARIEHKGFD